MVQLSLWQKVTVANCVRRSLYAEVVTGGLSSLVNGRQHDWLSA
jgi:hypothetical protein